MNKVSAERITRRQLLRRAAVGSGVILAAGRLPATALGNADSAAASHVTHQLGWIKITQYGGFFAAEAQGYYKNERIDVNFQSGGPNLIASNVVATGHALVGDDDNVTILQAIDKGEPLVMIGALLYPESYGVFSLPSKPIRTLKDFENKVIAIYPPTKGQIIPILKQHGVDVGKIHFVPQGPDPSAFINHKVDGYFGSPAYSEGIAIRKAGVKYIFASFAHLFFPVYGNPIITTQDALKRNRALLVKYMRASIRGWEWMLKYPRATAKLTVDHYGVSGLRLADETSSALAQVPLIRRPDGRVLTIDKGQIAKQLAVAHKVGIIKHKLDVNEIVDTSIVNAAYGGRKYLPL